MNSWKAYLLAVISCGLICGVLLQLVSDSHTKKLLQMICGVVAGISLLRPLSGIRLQDWYQADFPAMASGHAYIAEGEKTAQEAQERIITESCEAYIENRAKALGADVQVNVRLNRDQIPDLAEIRGNPGPEIQMQLQEILSEDLGIPKENQSWIWNQENSSSFTP